MKTRDLSGRALDYAVALIELEYFREQCTAREFVVMHSDDSDLHYTAGSAGDDIIDREKIGTEWVWSIDEPCWQAWIAAHSVARFQTADGTTRREAAMRCYVASKLGDSIDIPKELQ